MKKMTRLMRHLTTTRATGRHTFPAHTLKAIQTAIAQGEAQHRAEIRLIVEPALTLRDVMSDLAPRERARELFAHHRIWDTEENCGILIYINLADHKVEIIADRAVGRALPATDWQAVCQTMTQGFARGDFHDSAVAALSELNALLKTHFPANGLPLNELPNRPLVL
ncbi:MAG: TPM domain-containing protein [Burkholderiaceae bacterium]